MLKIAIKTLGCKANRYESDKLLDELGASAEIVGINDNADIIVVNTCTVTHVADRKSRQIVGNLKTKFPDAKVVVFGCGARTSRDQYEAMQVVDYIARDRDDLRNFIIEHRPQTLTHDGMYLSTAKVDAIRTRSLIKVQDGCDRFCSYCIIPYSRGLPRSFPAEDVIQEIKEKEAQGYKEVVITGINIGDWQQDGQDFGDLLEKILAATTLPRIRISSIEPCNFSDKFYQIMQNPRICEHLHLCLQAGSDDVLKQMGRKYDTKIFAEIVARLKKAVPNIAITTDMITGFPGESAQNFEEGRGFAREMAFAKIHVFPYSKRRNTPAAKFEQVVYAEKKDRVRALLQTSKELELEFKNRFLGDQMEILFEESDDQNFEGYSSNYIRVRVQSSTNLSNQIHRVLLKSIAADGVVLGELV